MKINVIDYRGDATVINSRGDTLFNYRTKYFHKMQEDFYLWKEHGHTFQCWTQHQNRNQFVNDYWAFDQVSEIPRSSAPEARNIVLDSLPKDIWCAIWDNDTTLYWDKLKSKQFPKDLSALTNYCDQENIRLFQPFNSQQSPYPKKISSDFKTAKKIKGTQMYLKTTDIRFQNFTALEDWAFGLDHIQRGYKLATCMSASLREFQTDKSTIFGVNVNSKLWQENQHLHPWDGELERRRIYAEAKQIIIDKYKELAQ